MIEIIGAKNKIDNLYEELNQFYQWKNLEFYIKEDIKEELFKCLDYFLEFNSSKFKIRKLMHQMGYDIEIFNSFFDRHKYFSSYDRTIDDYKIEHIFLFKVPLENADLEFKLRIVEQWY